LVLWDQAGHVRARVATEGRTVSSLAFAPDGKILAGGCTKSGAPAAPKQGEVRFWDPATGAEGASLAANHGGIVALGFSPGGSLLAAADTQGTIQLWDVASKELRHSLPAGQARVIALSPDGKTLAATLADKTITLWDLDRRQVRLTLRGRSGAPLCVAF